MINTIQPVLLSKHDAELMNTSAKASSGSQMSMLRMPTVPDLYAGKLNFFFLVIYF